MSRRVDFTLTDEQLAEIEEAINHAPYPEVRQRAIAIRLLHKGYKPEQVADLVAISANTIWFWHRRWREEGMTGLQDQPRSGRPRKATAEYCRVLEETLNSDASYGYSFTVLTMESVCGLIRNSVRAFASSQTQFAMVLEREAVCVKGLKQLRSNI